MSELELARLADLELARVSGALSMAEVGTELYERLLDDLNKLFWFSRNLAAPVDGGRLAADDTPTPTTPAPAEPAPEVADAPGAREEATAPAVDRVALRAALAEAKGLGVNIAELIKSLGASKYSELPDDKLAELDKLRRDAVEALG